MDRLDAGDALSKEKIIDTESRRLKVLNRIQGQGYREPFSLGPVKITFYEAGHVPGAAMILIESQTDARLLSAIRCLPGYFAYVRSLC